MARLTLALVAWMSLASVSSADVARKELAKSDKAVAQAPAQESGESSELRFGMTAQTQVLLNGRPCKYEDVPPHARITYLEIAADRKTVLKAHFRTRR